MATRQLESGSQSIAHTEPVGFDLSVVCASAESLEAVEGFCLEKQEQTKKLRARLTVSARRKNWGNFAGAVIVAHNPQSLPKLILDSQQAASYLCRLTAIFSSICMSYVNSNKPAPGKNLGKRGGGGVLLLIVCAVVFMMISSKNNGNNGQGNRKKNDSNRSSSIEKGNVSGIENRDVNGKKMPTTGRNQAKGGFSMTDVDNDEKSSPNQSTSKGGFEMEDVYPNKQGDTTGLKLNDKKDTPKSDWELDTDAGKSSNDKSDWKLEDVDK